MDAVGFGSEMSLEAIPAGARALIDANIPIYANAARPRNAVCFWSDPTNHYHLVWRPLTPNDSVRMRRLRP